MQVAYGSGIFFVTPITDAYGNNIASPTPIMLGVLQDASVDVSFDTTQLYGQNQFPADIGRGKGKLDVKANNAQILAAGWNALMFGMTITDGATRIFNDLTGQKIPSSATALMPDIPTGAVLVADLGPRTAAGVRFERVASAPDAGQYSFDPATGYTFAVADADTTVLLPCRYTIATEGQTIVLPNLPMGEIPTFRADLQLVKGGKTTYVSVFRCASSKLSFATKNADFAIPSFDMSGFDDGSGQVYQVSTSE